ncbi:MAG TPA: hypothetical protein VGD87_17680 [Archangium sp.]
MITVRLVTRAGEVLVRVPKHTTLLGAVVKAGVPIGQSCRGEGALEGQRSEIDPIEAEFLARRGSAPSHRFACRARVVTDSVISTGSW